MNRETKEKICNWIIKKILGTEFTFTITRKGYLEEIARDINKYPNSKISVLRVLRLDGTSFKDAMKIYDEIQ